MVAPQEAGTFELLGILPRSSNSAILVRLGDAEDPDAPLAVYKPQAGERPLWDFEEGTLCLREVAASRVADALGWPNIPTTTLVEGPLGIGSLSRFVPFDPEHHFFTLREAHADEMRRIAAFDVIANNADRKGGHCLLGEDGLVFSIDHGLCFNEDDKLRTVIWDYAGEPLPADIASDLARLEVDLGQDAGTAAGALRDELAELLSTDEMTALRQRIRGLLAEGVYPEPWMEPAIPWPPI